MTAGKCSCSLDFSQDLWGVALGNLNEDDRANLNFNCPNRLHIIVESLKLTNDAKEECRKKAWRFRRKSGEEVFASDVLAKVSRWINYFKAVGDTIVQYNPAYAALPWAGVRFVLQVCLCCFLFRHPFY